VTQFRRLAAAAVATVIVLAGAPGAFADETTTTTPSEPPLPLGLSLVSQDPAWVGLHGSFKMQLHLERPALAQNPNAAIAVQIHQSVDSRSGFDDAIADENLGGTLYAPDPIRLSTLRRTPANDVIVTFGLSGSEVQPTIGISRPGVYPVEVQLVNTGTVTRRFVSWLVVVDTDGARAIDKPLSVGLVLAAVADPMVLPNGDDDPRVVKEMSRGGRLDRVAAVLSSTRGFRYSLVLGPETADAWRRVAAKKPATALGFARVRASALRPSTEVLPVTYVPIDQSSVIAAGLGQYLPEQYLAATAALRSALGQNPSPTPAQAAFIDPAPTSDAVVDQLRQMLIDRVGVREQALIPVTHPFSPAQGFVLDTTGGEARGLATAPFVEDLFRGPDPSALKAQRVIAAVAEVAYETPSVARGLLVAPAENWSPDVRMMQIVIGALRTLPLVQPATLDDLFGSGGVSTEQSEGSDVQRRLMPAVPEPPPVDPTDYEATANQLAAYRDVVGPADPVFVNGRAALLAALSTSISPERAAAVLARINSEIDAYTSSITAEQKRITLTSRRADVPLTFENNLRPARPVKVRVHLDSTKLTFPNGADQEVTLRPGSNTIRFSVEARASGTFPMTISVTSPNGKLAFGQPVQVSVRSAVFGGWAVGLTIAALIFLAGWWANHFRRTRKLRRDARASGVPTPAPTPTA
jgi:hypothetical protein